MKLKRSMLTAEEKERDDAEREKFFLEENDSEE